MSNETINTELEDVLVSTIEETINLIGDAGIWIQGEIPEIVHQLLLWKATISFVSFSFYIFILIFTCILIKRIKKWCNDETERDYSSPPREFCYTIPIFLPVFTMPFFDLDWLQIWVAPKIYLIEYMTELIK